MVKKGKKGGKMPRKSKAKTSRGKKGASVKGGSKKSSVSSGTTGIGTLLIGNKQKPTFFKEVIQKVNKVLEVGKCLINNKLSSF